MEYVIFSMIVVFGTIAFVIYNTTISSKKHRTEE